MITAFSRERKVMTLSEVAEVTEMTRAAARRFLLTYTHLGYMASNGRNFELTAKVLNLGYNYLSSLDIIEIARPLMLQLSNEVNESCSIATLDKLEIVYLLRQQVSRIMTISLGAGSRLPVHVTSMGRILLAMNDTIDDSFLENLDYKQYTINSITSKEQLKRELEIIRKQGWTLVDQELEAGVRSISVPIFSKNNQVIYAMNIGVQSNRVSKEQLIEDFLPHLQETCSKISTALKKQ